MDERKYVTRRSSLSVVEVVSLQIVEFLMMVQVDSFAFRHVRFSYIRTDAIYNVSRTILLSQIIPQKGHSTAQP